MHFAAGAQRVLYPRTAVRIFLLLGLSLVMLATASTAGAAPGSKVGIYDEASTLYSNDTSGFDMLQELGVDTLRLNMYWDRVARTRPANAANHEDPAYDWSGYDRAVRLAAERNIEVLFSIIATPGWANGGKGAKYAPTKSSTLRNFAIAAATRYSGKFTPPGQSLLPRVSKWLAWNEPNAPNFLLPQFRKVGNRYVIASPAIYARICNAVVGGVHVAGSRAGVKETVACGATNPRGKLRGNGRRDSVAPLLFLREMKKAGARFDVYAHHPYSPTRHVAPNERIRVDHGHTARQHRRPAERADTAVRSAHAAVDHRVRLPDESTRPGFRRLVEHAGALPEAGVRDRTADATDRHDALVPAEGRAGSRPLELGPAHGFRRSETIVRGVPRRRGRVGVPMGG